MCESKCKSKKVKVLLMHKFTFTLYIHHRYLGTQLLTAYTLCCFTLQLTNLAHISYCEYLIFDFDYASQGPMNPPFLSACAQHPASFGWRVGEYMLRFAVASQPMSLARSAGFCGPISWCSPGSLIMSYTQPSLQSCTGHMLATPAPLGPLEALGYTGPVHPLWSVDPPLRPCVRGDTLAAPSRPPPTISLWRPLMNVLGETCKYVRAQLVSAPPLRIIGHISMLST